MLDVAICSSSEPGRECRGLGIVTGTVYSRKYQLWVCQVPKDSNVDSTLVNSKLSMVDAFAFRAGTTASKKRAV